MTKEIKSPNIEIPAIWPKARSFIFSFFHRNLHAGSSVWWVARPPQQLCHGGWKAADEPPGNLFIAKTQGTKTLTRISPINAKLTASTRCDSVQFTAEVRAIGKTGTLNRTARLLLSGRHPGRAYWLFPASHLPWLHWYWLPGRHRGHWPANGF